MGMAEDGQAFGGDQHLDASREAGLTPDQACALEGEHHLVHGRWADLEVALHVGLGRRTAMDARVGVDEGQVLALLVGEAGSQDIRHTLEIAIHWASQRRPR